MVAINRLLFGILVMSCLSVACANNSAGPGNVKYHYSDKILDNDTQAILDKMKTPEYKPLFYVDAATLEKSWDELKDSSYSAYSGAVPDYDFVCDTSSVFDSNGYRTLVMGDSGAYNIMYVHGGAWTYPLLTSHLSFLEDFTSRANVRAYVPLYPMLPNWNINQSLVFLQGVYDRILEEGKPVVLMGDSAGGNMILGFTAYLQANGKELPGCLLPLSPAVDLSASNPEIDKYQSADPMLGRDIFDVLGPAWSGDVPIASPVVSPINAELEHFPKAFIYIGTEEILYPDAIRFAEKLSSAGVCTEVLIGQGLWHVAPLSKIPVRDLYIDLAQKFIHKCL